MTLPSSSDTSERQRSASAEARREACIGARGDSSRTRRRRSVSGHRGTVCIDRCSSLLSAIEVVSSPGWTRRPSCSASPALPSLRVFQGVSLARLRARLQRFSGAAFIEGRPRSRSSRRTRTSCSASPALPSLRAVELPADRLDIGLLQRFSGAAFIEGSGSASWLGSVLSLQRFSGAAFIEGGPRSSRTGSTRCCSASPALPSLRVELHVHAATPALLQRFSGAAFIEGR